MSLEDSFDALFKGHTQNLTGTKAEVAAYRTMAEAWFKNGWRCHGDSLRKQLADLIIEIERKNIS